MQFGLYNALQILFSQLLVMFFVAAAMCQYVITDFDSIIIK
jgi:hypothetical protein